jgi:hypothetical protein
MSDSLPLPQARFLTRDQAAAYLGVGATTFNQEVQAGIWPPAMKRGTKGSALTWDIKLLDRAADRLGGLLAAEASDAGLAAAEQAALEATRRGPSQANRPQHRHAKAR